MNEFFSNPETLWLIGSVLVGFLAEGLRRIIRIEKLMTRVDMLETWQASLVNDLDTRFARKDVVDVQLANLKESNQRIEYSLAEMRKEIKDSVHTFRHDVLVPFVNLVKELRESSGNR